MPTCDICDKEVDKVYKCKSCDVDFCASCGSSKDLLCDYCSEPEEEEDFNA
jgi:hypothetical protein